MQAGAHGSRVEAEQRINGPDSVLSVTDSWTRWKVRHGTAHLQRDASHPSEQTSGRTDTDPQLPATCADYSPTTPPFPLAILPVHHSRTNTAKYT